MSEIELLYKNAGVEKQEQGYCDWDSDCPYDIDKDCGKTCPYWVEEEPDYPPFTAEKQLELIKWLGKYDYFEVYYRPVQKDWIIGNKTVDNSHYDFTLGLASWIVDIWQDLTEQERTEIRSILNGN